MKSEMRAKVLVAAVALPMSMLTAYAVADGPSEGLGEVSDGRSPGRPGPGSVR